MGVRTGAEYLQGLRSSPRDVWVGGQRVDNVADHPAFCAVAREIAALYDMQHQPEHRDSLTALDAVTGERCGIAFEPAQTVDDLRRRREGFRLWAEASFGLLGRSPDFLNTTLLALWEDRSVFGEAGERYADSVAWYYDHVRRHDLFLSHALVPPQNDRTKQSHEQGALHLRVTGEEDGGIRISGARMIATLGPVADEILLYNLPGMKPGDEDHALICAVPASAPGLRQICRQPYVIAGERASFDHPLSTRFEENDSLLVFHDVFVPWQRVFSYRNVKLSGEMYFRTAIRNHTAYQTNTRALAKMQFATGLAMAVARSIGADTFLHVQHMLGECIGYVEHLKSGLARAEVEAERTASGTLRPALAPLQTLRTMLPQAYPRVIEILQTIGAGGFMLMPSGADLAAEEIAGDTATYYAGAQLPSIDRVKLFKLAWDLAGEAFGQRLVQYERYYAGDPVRNIAGTYLAVDDTDYRRLVDAALALAGEPQPAGAAPGSGA
ncbi:4-hydroxyphenylacetate 3-hydroxylase N-terminal domain-containing protein [Sphingomonas sp. AR_OL41]|uniref:4-hydroxyphenylacetate 3-hydroxylase family protein n=1 Tax=Sphingomonas sp. AR_OL41 TaxID=3042729 RepID=UPI0024813FD1|nr:4-hydroxyphenylacetate 3-hydroxylase N-terminal domain-containing protein [Sphingomonas sp. AR_OL41]MDH7972965.1 4-hydroxyphenylacetate 3-hydroxylase N-terminal domain-containing protein [Sphingomonas sp. AR_OL41]